MILILQIYLFFYFNFLSFILLINLSILLIINKLSINPNRLITCLILIIRISGRNILLAIKLQRCLQKALLLITRNPKGPKLRIIDNNIFITLWRAQSRLQLQNTRHPFLRRYYLWRHLSDLAINNNCFIIFVHNVLL